MQAGEARPTYFYAPLHADRVSVEEPPPGFAPVSPGPPDFDGPPGFAAGPPGFTAGPPGQFPAPGFFFWQPPPLPWPADPRALFLGDRGPPTTPPPPPPGAPPPPLPPGGAGYGMPPHSGGAPGSRLAAKQPDSRRKQPDRSGSSEALELAAALDRRVSSLLPRLSPVLRASLLQSCLLDALVGKRTRGKSAPQPPSRPPAAMCAAPVHGPR